MADQNAEIQFLARRTILETGSATLPFPENEDWPQPNGDQNTVAVAYLPPEIHRYNNTQVEVIFSRIVSFGAAVVELADFRAQKNG